MSMVERVAKAMIAERVKADGDESAVVCMAKYGLEYLRDARAAIEAMRQATPEMIDAGRWEAEQAERRGQHGEAIWMDAHGAMIDAALLEPAHDH